MADQRPQTTAGAGEWKPIALACARIIDHLDPLSDRLATTIVAEVEAYRSLTIDQIRYSLDALARTALQGLAEHRHPTDDEKKIAYVLGRQRAHNGQSVDAVISAFQVGFREWLNELFPLVPARHRRLLLEAITTMWTWLYQMSEAATQGWTAEAGRQQALIAQTRERFVDAIRRGDTSAEEYGQRLGFDPAGPFLVAWLRSPVDQEAVVSGVHGITHLIPYGRDAIVVSQGIGVEQLEETLIGAAGTVGVGLPRRGLDGARASMLDAERSVELAEALGAPLVVFERDWLRATLYAEREYLRPLLDRAIATCTEHPHIAEAALAFSAGGLSQSEAARRLHLRPSSLNYRLQRWNELSGDDLASPEGLACVAVASLCGDDRKMRDFR